VARTYRVDASGFPYWNKDPEARLDYSFDWSEWLPAGCVIASVAHTVPAGLTLLAQSYTSTTGLLAATTRSRPRFSPTLLAILSAFVLMNERSAFGARNGNGVDRIHYQGC
jgi:hypothetical protein